MYIATILRVLDTTSLRGSPLQMDGQYSKKIRIMRLVTQVTWNFSFLIRPS